MEPESVVTGDFSRLPPLDSNIVRIFLSSTFGDFIEERNWLSHETFPHLQTYCQTLGLEFQVVDLRWGLRDENISYHQTSDVCIQEIYNCQRLSLGPSFLALIGDRYGYRPFPATIPFEEFQSFLVLGLAHDICTRMLSMWYKLDHNAVTKVFQLMPITVHYPNHSSKDQKLRKVDQDGWWNTFLALQRTFWALVKLAVKEGKMTEERAHTYFQSITEDEIDLGIFRASSPEDSCLCYTRTLSDLHSNLQDNSAYRYMDVLPDSSPYSVDVEAQALLQHLKYQRLPQALNSGSNFHSYCIPWVSGGLREEVVEHKKYLNDLCAQVLTDVRRLIDTAMKARTYLYSALQSEILHHALLCSNKCESYCDRRDGVLAEIQEYVLSSAAHPLVIYGKSGSGKTSVMAKAAKCMQEWSASLLVVRFLGTSPRSSTIREVLVSVTEQVCGLYSICLPFFDKMDTIDIVQYFRNELIASIGNNPNSHGLIVMLDSIDQLSPTDGAHSMKWLPLFLPPNLRIIISMLCDKCGCFENIQAILPVIRGSYVELGSLSIGAGMEMMDMWLSKIGRTLTSEQRAIIANAFLSCPQPLFLKLVFGEARTWKSYRDNSSLVISGCVQEALLQFYKSLEVQFGEVLVQKALGYFTAAKSGLTEAELDDVLSLDNEVLNDVYQYWDPPVKDVVRIPSLLWKRIHHFIADYIVEQQADGKTVLMWYHRQFNESASSRYVKEGTAKETLHVMLSQFFEGTWGNGAGKSVNLEHRKLFIKDAKRQVPAQPLRFSDKVYNNRKLSELPYHLLHSNQINKLKGEVLCHFNWIHTKLNAVGFADTVQDYLSALEIYKSEKDVSMVCETISLSGSNLKNDPDMLAGEFLGRLLSIQLPSSFIAELLKETKKWMKEAKECLFQPLNNCLISPGGELQVTITGHPQVILGIEKSLSLPLLVSYSNGSGCGVFNVWDLTSLQCIENVSTLKVFGDKSLQPSNYVLTHSHLVTINLHCCALWNIKTGECMEHIEQFGGDKELSCLAATDDCQCILVGTGTGRVHFLMNRLGSPQESTTLKFDGAIKSIDVAPDNKLSLIVHGTDGVAIVDNQSKVIVNSTSFDLVTSVLHTARSKDGLTHLIAGTTVGSVCFSQFASLSFTTTPGHSKTVKCVTHIASLNLVITGSLDKTMCVWDIHQCSMVQRLEGHMDSVWCLDSLPNSSRVVSGSKDDYLKVWDVLSGECLHTLEGHSSWISCVKAVSPDVIVSGSNDKTLKFWKLGHSRIPESSLNRHVAQPECIALSGHKVSASGGPDAVKIWNPLDGKCLFSLPTSASCLTFTSNGKNLIVGTKSGTIKIYDTLDSYKQIKVLEKHKGKVVGVLSLDTRSGSILVSASLDSTLVVWSDCFKFTLLCGHTAGVTTIASTQDRQVVASGSQDGDIFMWDILLSRSIGSSSGHCKTVNCLAFNADRTRLVSGSDDKTARVWNTTDMSCITIVNYSDSIKTLCFTDLNTFVAGAHCSQKQLRSWNSETGECLIDFVGHTHAVMCMLLTDGSTIVTGSRDGTVQAWSSETCSMLASFDLQSQVKHIALSKTPDGELLLAATTKSGPIAFLKIRARAL